MKQLLPNGLTLIASENIRRYRHRFDPWPTHCAGFIGCAMVDFEEIYIRFAFDCALKDGFNYNYLGAQFPVGGSGNAWFDSIANFQVPGYPGNWFGEGFNAIGRPTINFKERIP